MNSKHTPGPWIYADGNNYCCEVQIGETTASLTRDTKYRNEYVISRDEMESNVRLIAGAPDMLNALNEALVTIVWMSDYMDVIDEQNRATAFNNYANALEIIRDAIHKATS